jgi:UDP-N-acetylmuramate: L-alanyl-gamma-D-glutamyl-meso-diaminopimelate ligase
MRFHFIAIGGAVMHNLAIALHLKGHNVTGSDDEIFEPSRSRLKSLGLLPEEPGWFPEKISRNIDAVILGMHARADNPELLKAINSGIKIMSLPEFIYNQTINKKRIVVAGSHGKTTTTAMIMHVLRQNGRKFDYLVGSSIDGYETMVGLSDDSKIAVIEGDEYLTSSIDRRPKFHLYMPDIAILNGISWDHMNVFPTFSDYIDQFRIFITKISEGGILAYFIDDPCVRELADSATGNIIKVPYRTHGHFRNCRGFFAATHNRTLPVRVFGEHNMQNLSAAREACLAAGISEDEFYSAIQSFEGAAKRLQILKENEKGTAYLDFAHSPSKVRATVEAISSYYPGRPVIACLELHTYSSLNIDFIPLYNGALDKAAYSYVYFNPVEVSAKKLPPLTRSAVRDAFANKNLDVFSDSEEFFLKIRNTEFMHPVFLFMSSGNFDGQDMKLFAEELLNNN